MANRLKMAEAQSIMGLARLGWSYRRIASELGVDRQTVSRHVQAMKAAQELRGDATWGVGPTGSTDSNATVSITGLLGGQALVGEAQAEEVKDPEGDLTVCSAAVLDANATISITGSDRADGGEAGGDGGDVPGRRSLCEALRAVIVEGLERGLTARRIWQDLRDDSGFAGDYQSVQRFVRKLKESTPLPFRRMECEPGEEAQVDFGCGAPIVGSDGKRKRPHLFRVVLSHSRKAYSEVVLRQTTEQFLRCIENAFWQFGGVTRTVVIDNLKAAVTTADWYDPELNPKIEAFCRHYGTTVLPTRPRTPRHKGKVERGVGYAQSNALKGRTFTSLAQQNQFLQEWEATIADTRIHGTTRKQVGARFNEVERAALLPLPAGRFPSFQEAQRIVNRDGHVEVAKAYYSAPPEYVGLTIWARWDGRVVRLFDRRMRQIAIHAQGEPGRFATDAGHIDARKRGGIERGTAWWLAKAGDIGAQAGQWAQDILQARGVHGVRVVMGLVSLTRRHRPDAVEEACRIAQSHGAHRLRDIRNLLKRSGSSGTVQEQFEFVQQHPLIRPLTDYSKLIHEAFDQTCCTTTTKAEATISAGDCL
jgi:transposase